jgi:hypothetical protein
MSSTFANTQIAALAVHATSRRVSANLLLNLVVLITPSPERDEC